ncbi:putative KilA protein [Vibrio phage 381E49-1]|nr:putative KilA protein [Vibrio phage 381E49-1]
MLPIIQDANEVTMNSVDFLNFYINPARESEGYSKVAYKDFIARVIDETDKEHEEIFLMESTGGRTRHVVNLSYDEMLLVGMRESKAVRRSVLIKLKELSAPKEDPMVLLARQVIALDEENKRLAATKAQINDKRTATIMGRLGNAAKTIKKLEDRLQDVGTYQSLTASKIPARVDTEMKNNVQSWRLLKQLSSDMQLPPKKVKCERYGEVLAYHVDVIELFKSKYL